MLTKTSALLFFLAIICSNQYAQNTTIPEGYKRKYIVSAEKKWDKKRVDVFILDKTGNTFEGQLLYVNDSILYLFVSDKLFYKNSGNSPVYSFSSDEIQRIVLKRSPRLKEGIIAGAIAALAAPVYATIEFTGTGEEGWLILLVPVLYVGSAVMTIPTGLALGLTYGVNIDYQTKGGSSTFKILSEEINKYSLFNDEPNFLQSQKSTSKEIFSDIILPEYKDRRKDILGYNKMHIGASAGIVKQFLVDDINSHIKNNLSSDFYKSTDLISPLIGVGVGYRLKDKFKLGFEISGWNYSTIFEDYDFNNYDDPYTFFSFDYTITSFAANVNYIINPVKRLMSRRNEFSFGAGIAMNTFYSNNSYTYFDTVNIYEPYDLDAELFFNMHVNASISYDLYIFQFLSAHIELRGQYAINKIETNEFKLTDINDVEYTIPKGKFNTSTLSGEFGLRLHF